MPAADRDKPNVHTLASLDVEAGAEPYVYMTKARKRVTFPDPGEMDAFDAEDMLISFSDPQVTSKEMLKRWLTETDFEALVAERLKLNQMLALIADVQRHYEAIFGKPGESPASES